MLTRNWCLRVHKNKWSDTGDNSAVHSGCKKDDIWIGDDARVVHDDNDQKTRVGGDGIIWG